MESRLGKVVGYAAGIEIFFSRYYGLFVLCGNETGIRHSACTQKPLNKQAIALPSLLELFMMKNQSIANITDQLLYDAPVAIVVIDDEGKIVFANKRTQDLFGYDANELHDQPFSLLLPKRLGGSLVKTCQASINNPLLHQTSAAHDLNGIRKDGGEFPLEIDFTFHETEEGVFASCVLRDITRRKRLDEQLCQVLEQIDQQRQMLDTILSASADYVFLHDRSGRYLFASEPALRDLGLEKEAIEGKTWRELGFPADAMETFEAELESVFATGNPSASEITFPTLKGLREFETRLTPVRSADGSIRAVVSTVRDITERKQHETQLFHQANYDTLTQLPNRNLLSDRLEHALAHAHRQGRQVAILFLDLDRFKMINDSLGHRVGDTLLKAVADRLKGCLREDDTVARLGGDEFVIVLEDLASEDGATRVAQKVLASMDTPFSLEGQDFFINCSIGISLFPRDGEDMDALLKNADTALHRAKDQGRNQLQFYTSAMNAHFARRITMENGLRYALEGDQLRLYYQPQVALDTGRIVGVEALLRWQHPQMGLVMPGDFIPLAEETGLIVSIGAWALKTACAQARSWQEAGLHPVIMSVNLSVRQFMQASLAKDLARLLQETGLNAEYLKLEITESLLMRDTDGAIPTLHALKTMGVGISIDDFGTGYSSLNYLKRFPITQLKIDRSFVQDITTDPGDAAITQSIIALGHSLGLSVIAEGVETREQMDFLKARHCDQMQGYYVSRPLPAQEMTALLQKRVVEAG